MDLDNIRREFPILSREIYGKPLVYLDNGATAQKPKAVVDAMSEEYFTVNANVHRGVHFLSQRATDLHEAARETVRAHMNASSINEVIFTRGTTESINLVAACLGESFFKAGDEIIISAMEHHSNIVPWQMVAERKGLVLRIIPINDKGELLMDEFAKLLSSKTKLVSVTHVSNVLGTINPVEEIIRMAHANDTLVLIDGAQAIPHTKVDVQKLDADFYVFSGHKVYGPTGIGVLYGKEKLLDMMPPYQGGGEMIERVSFEKTTFNTLPYKFEAGTPDFVGTHGLAVALDYINNIGLEKIEAHERMLTEYAMSQLRQIEGMTFYGEAENKTSVVSFLVKGIHHFDMGTLLDRLGIAVRTGHHCAQPLMERFGIEGTVRASFALYNTKEEVDILIKSVDRVAKMF